MIVALSAYRWSIEVQNVAQTTLLSFLVVYIIVRDWKGPRR